MKDLLTAARALLFDFTGTLLYLGLFAATHSLPMAVAMGLAAALGQIGWESVHRRRVDALQWVSLALVGASGAAALLTANPLFVMLKPSVVYILIGAAMLQRGWMTRYMPAEAQAFLPDVIVAFGYVWAGLMLLSAVLNLAVATSAGGNVATWGAVMSAWALASKPALFLIQYALMRMIGLRRRAAAATQ